MLEVGSIEQSECTASFTLRSENPDRTGVQQRNPESNPAGNPGGNPEGYPAAEHTQEETLRPDGREPVTRWRPVCTESRQRRPWGSSSATRVAFILAVAQLFAVTTLEVGVTSRSGALLLLWPLLLTAGRRRTSGRAPVFESLKSKI